MPTLLQNSLFIHTPRTGSTFCHDVMRNMGLIKGEIGHRHDKWENLNQNEQYNSKPFKFCFVRDPLDWYKSYWAFRMTHGWRPDVRTDMNFLDLYCRSDDFETFICNIFKRYPNGFIGDLMLRYQFNCDFVGRYENLREDLIKALRLASERFDPDFIRSYQVRNASNKKYKEVKVSENIINLVYEKETQR